MKYLITISIFLFCIHLNAQTIRFNKVLEDTLSNIGFNVVQLDTGYVVSGVTGINGYQSLIIKGVDIQGDVRWNKHIVIEEHKQAAGFYQIKRENEGNYILTGTIDDLAGDWSVMVYKFNEYFDTLWTKTYFEDTITATSHDMIQDSNGDYLIVGSLDTGLIGYGN